MVDLQNFDVSDVKICVCKQCLHSYVHGESACEGANANRTLMQVTIYLFFTFGGVSGKQGCNCGVNEATWQWHKGRNKRGCQIS